MQVVAIITQYVKTDPEARSPDDGKKLILTMSEIVKMEATKRNSRSPRSMAPTILFGTGVFPSWMGI